MPTHSWMRMLYKYLHAEFPYAQLVEENRRRGAGDPEFELIDTGVFDDNRYFDVEITYAKAAPDDILMEVVVVNRGSDEAVLQIIPQLWARNNWSWEPGVPPQTSAIALVVAEQQLGGPVANQPRRPHLRMRCQNFGRAVGPQDGLFGASASQNTSPVPLSGLRRTPATTSTATPCSSTAV